MASSMTSSITVVEVQPQQENPVVEDDKTSSSNSAVLEPVNPASTIVSSIKVLPVARSSSITRMEIQIASPTLEMTNASLSPMSPSTTTTSSSIIDGEHHLEHMEGTIMNPLAYRSELSGGEIQRREMIEKIIAEKEKATANIDAMLKSIENQLDQTEKERASIIGGGDGESEICRQNQGNEEEGDDSSLPLPPPPLPLPPHELITEEDSDRPNRLMDATLPPPPHPSASSSSLAAHSQSTSISLVNEWRTGGDLPPKGLQHDRHSFLSDEVSISSTVSSTASLRAGGCHSLSPNHDHGDVEVVTGHQVGHPASSTRNTRMSRFEAHSVKSGGDVGAVDESVGGSGTSSSLVVGGADGKSLLAISEINTTLRLTPEPQQQQLQQQRKSRPIVRRISSTDRSMAQQHQQQQHPQ